jgi:heat shock protein HspQ
LAEGTLRKTFHRFGFRIWSRKYSRQKTGPIDSLSKRIPKYRINFERDESIKSDESIMKCEFLVSIEIEICEIFQNAESSIKSTSRGIVIDLRPEYENASDSMRLRRESLSNEIDWHHEKHDEERISTFQGIVIDLRPEYENVYNPIYLNRKSSSNEIDENDSQFKKHNEQRISTSRGIMIDLIRRSPKESRPMFATRTLAARQGKKADNWTTTSSPDANPTIVVDPLPHQH